jgi:hypothetical protein
MVNVAVASEPVRGEYGAVPPPPLVPSQLFGPRKNKPAAGMSGRPAPTGAQSLIVTWTTEPTGPVAGQTAIDECGRAPVAVAHLAAGDVLAGADAVAAGAEAGAGAAGVDDVAGAAVDGVAGGDVAAETPG